MSKALELANTHEADPKRRQDWERGARSELRRLAAVEEDLEALRRVISDAQPVAYEVYTGEADSGYWVDSLDDPQLIDDCTNHGAEVTPLYTLRGIK